MVVEEEEDVESCGSKKVKLYSTKANPSLKIQNREGNAGFFFLYLSSFLWLSLEFISLFTCCVNHK
jgi:hypothetical protein